jgi:glucuronoarabinoxylan endo-1,4-beta-xylanase
MKPLRLKIAIVIGICVSVFPHYKVNAQTVTISLSNVKQTIKGFGGMNCPTWGVDLTADQRTTAFGNGQGQLGMTILRLMVPENSGSFSREVATAKRAVELGATVFASPWNPPSAMMETVNGKRHLKTNMYADYATHLNSFVTYMKNNGVDLYAISVQNEPDYGDWTQWSSQEIVTFLKQNASTIQTKVIAPESFQYRKTMSDPILNDATALANIDMLGAHLYGTQLRDFPYPLFKEKGVGKELWMTEVYTESNNDADLWPMALDVATNIHNAMVEAEFNVYTWWYIRRSYGMIKENGQISKRGYCMSQFTKFIRPGANRVDATKNPTTGVNISAYKSKNNDSLIIVAVNTTTSSKSVNFTIAGGSATSLSKYTTSGSKSMALDGSARG